MITLKSINRYFYYFLFFVGFISVSCTGIVQDTDSNFEANDTLITKHIFWHPSTHKLDSLSIVDLNDIYLVLGEKSSKYMEVVLYEYYHKEMSQNFPAKHLNSIIDFFKSKGINEARLKGRIIEREYDKSITLKENMDNNKVEFNIYIRETK